VRRKPTLAPVIDLSSQPVRVSPSAHQGQPCGAQPRTPRNPAWRGRLAPQAASGCTGGLATASDALCLIRVCWPWQRPVPS
jgi:hypothetical protein